MTTNHVTSSKQSNGDYHLKTLRAPILSGIALRFFAYIAERWRFLQRKILHNSGFGILIEPTPQVSEENEPGVEKPIHLYKDYFKVPAASPFTEEQWREGIASISSVFEVYYQLEFPGAAHELTAPSHLYSVWHYVVAYRSNQADPESLTLRLIQAIEQEQSKADGIRCISQINADHAIQQARESKQRYRNGCPISLLDGVPITIKEHFLVEGYVSSCGVRSFGPNHPQAEEYVAAAGKDCDLVRALKQCGAIIIGLTAMDELGLSVRAFNRSWGQVRNSVNPDYVSGGSTSGGAAAVGIGFGPLTIGSDAGGSIRIPSAFNGVVGLKTTFARFNCESSVDMMINTLHGGPIGACALDTALCFYYLCQILGPVDRTYKNDMLVSLPPIPNPSEISIASSKMMNVANETALNNIKVGVYWPWFNDSDPVIRDACNACLNFLKTRGGVEIVDIQISKLEEIRVASAVSIGSETYQGLLPFLDKPGFRNELGLDVRIKLAVASNFLDPNGTKSVFVESSDRIRAACLKDMRSIFSTVDLIVTPATAVLPPRVPRNLKTGESNGGLESRIMQYQPYANMTGIPAAVISCGVDGQTGLPIGIQFMAKPWNEPLIMRVLWWLEHFSKGLGAFPARKVKFSIVES